MAQKIKRNDMVKVIAGKDIDKEEIIKVAIDNKADMIGLCSLMTTTITQIDEVIAELNKSEYSTKVMIGGAVVTQEYADNVGADAYAPDGVEAVEIAKKLINK